MAIKYLGRAIGAFVLISYLGGCAAIQKEFDTGFTEMRREMNIVLGLEVDQDGKSTFMKDLERTKEGLWNIVTEGL